MPRPAQGTRGLVDSCVASLPANCALYQRGSVRVDTVRRAHCVRDSNRRPFEFNIEVMPVMRQCRLDAAIWLPWFKCFSLPTSARNDARRLSFISADYPTELP